MKVLVINDSDYDVGERLCFVVKVSDNAKEQVLFTIVDNIKKEYYEKIENEEFQDNYSLESYLHEKLIELGFELLDIAGEYDLSI